MGLRPSAGDDAWRDAPIRTFHGRHGRTTPRTRAALEELGPRHGLDARTDPTRPLVVEVGCGDGEAAVAFADAVPEVDIVGIDVHSPGVARLLEACAAPPRHNLFAERGDALTLLAERIPSAGLAGVHVFFPDPWPKARHQKRRFVRPDVLDLLADRVAPDGVVLVATDVADYAAWAIEHLDDHPAFEGGPTARPEWRPRTRYERRGLDAGRTVVDLAYRRR